MRKLSLTVLGMYVGLLTAFSQVKDTSTYKSRKLTLEEVNFVSGYYTQDGNNSAVTGGIGTEKLEDIATTIELRLSKYDRKYRKHSLSLEMGVDHYTSASSDKIDPYTVTSPSYADTRFYPSLGWSVQNDRNRTNIGLTASYSQEFDYQSIGIGGHFTKSSKDNNREFTVKLQAYFDNWSVILPVELRTNTGGGPQHEHDDDYPQSPRNSYSASFSFSQVVNPSLQLVLIAEPVYQEGLLGTKYQRVYFTDGSVHSENLPGTRMKIPLGLRATYFMGDRFILRPYYRYYQDDWGVKAQTAELEMPVKITPFFSLTPFYRFYQQTGADYFAPYKNHTAADTYFTSDYDLSNFQSHFFGAGIRLTPENGILGWRRFNAMEVRYGHYNRSNGLQSNQVSLHLRFK